MNIYCIYKQFYDIDGNPNFVEVIEADFDDIRAAKIAKLYNTQIPHDMRKKYDFRVVGAKVIDR